MRGEKARPDPHGLPGKNLKKELIPIILCGEAGEDPLFLRFSLQFQFRDTPVSYGSIISRDEIRGFGSFEVRQYGAYKGRNPKTGKIVDVPPKKLPFFKVGKELRELVNTGGV